MPASLTAFADDLAGLLQRAARAATGTKAAGLAVVAVDTGRVLMLQRSLEDGDPAGGKWEFPGGGLETGEDPLAAAKREWSEETGCEVPPGEAVGKWDSGVYCGYVWQTAREAAIPVFDGRDAVSNPDDPDGDRIEALAWWDLAQLTGSNPALRDELRQSLSKVLAAISCVTREGHLLNRSVVTTMLRYAGVVDEHGNLHSPADGRFVSKSGVRTGVLGAVLGKLESLREKLSDDDRSELDGILSQLRALESSDVDDDDLIDDEEDEDEAEDEVQADDDDDDDDEEESDGIVMLSPVGELSFISYDDGDLDVDWDEGGIRFSPQAAREVAAAVAEFGELPVAEFRELPASPAWVTDQEKFKQWYVQWSAEWDASPAGVAYSSVVGERLTSDGEIKVVRYGSGVYWIGDPETIDADDDTGILQLDDVEQGREFAGLLLQAGDEPAQRSALRALPAYGGEAGRRGATGEHWKHQPRDPGGEGGGQWVSAGPDLPDADIDGESSSERQQVFGDRSIGSHHFAAFTDPHADYLPAPGRGVAVRTHLDDEFKGERDIQESWHIQQSEAETVARAVEELADDSVTLGSTGDEPVLVKEIAAGSMRVAVFDDPKGLWDAEDDRFIAILPSRPEYQLDDARKNPHKYLVLATYEADDFTEALRATAASKPRAKQGLPRAKDKLRLDGHIDLADGELLAGSAEVTPPDSDFSVLAASTIGPSGPTVRLNIGDESEYWEGGNSDSTTVLDADGVAALDKAFAELADLAKADRARLAPLIAEADAKTELLDQEKEQVIERDQERPLDERVQAQVDDLTRQIDALTAGSPVLQELKGLIARKNELLQMTFGEETDTGYERIPLPPDLQQELDTIQARIPQINRHPDVQMSDDLWNRRRRIEMDGNPLSPEAEAEIARIDAAIADIWKQSPEVDGEIGRRVIPGTQWGDLVLEADGTEWEGDQPATDAWRVKAGIAPHGQGHSWDLYRDGNQVEAKFNPEDIAVFLKKIGKLVALADSAVVAPGSRSGLGHHRAADVAAWNSANPRNPKDADGKWTETPGGAARVGKKIADWFKSDSYKKISTGGHVTLSVIGLAPVFGEPADLMNAAWYLAERRPKNALLALGSAVPGLGYITAVRKALKHIKTARNLIKVRQEKRVAQAQTLLAAKKAARAEASATRSGAPAGRTAFGVALDGKHDRELLAQLRERWGTDPRPWAVLHAHITQLSGEETADKLTGDLYVAANGERSGNSGAGQSRAAARVAVSIVDAVVGYAYTPQQWRARLDFLRGLNGHVRKPEHWKDQPRDPGGEGGGRWVAGSASAMAGYATRVAALTAAYESGIKERELLAGGRMGETWAVRFNDGTKGVLKTAKLNPEFPMLKPHLQVTNEVLGAKVGAATGLSEMPVAIRVDRETVLKEWGEGELAPSFKSTEFEQLLAENSDDLHRLGFYDVLTQNGDRHNLNLLIRRQPDGRTAFVPIDQGNLFGPVTRDESREVIPLPEYSNPEMTNPFTRTGKVDRNQRPEVEYLSGGMSVTELEEIEERLKALKPDFDQEIPHQYKAMMERLAIMLVHARYLERKRQQGRSDERLYSHRSAHGQHDRHRDAGPRRLDVQRRLRGEHGGAEAGPGLDQRPDSVDVRRLVQRRREDRSGLTAHTRRQAVLRPGELVPFKKDKFGKWRDLYGQYADLPDVPSKPEPVKTGPVATATGPLRLQALKVSDLREHAKAAGIKGYSKLRKPELIAALTAKPVTHERRGLHAPDAANRLAPIFHDLWRAPRLKPDGRYEPKEKPTTDQAWIAKHGTDKIDIANTPFAGLPRDWQAENRAAAEFVVDLLRKRGSNLSREQAGAAIHDAWLERNPSARGGELDVPFARLPKDQQDKDIAHYEAAVSLFGGTTVKGATGNEPLRPDGQGSLGKVPAAGVRPDAGPGSVLRPAGAGDRRPDSTAEAGLGDDGTGGRDVPGKAATAKHGKADGRIAGAPRDAAVGGSRRRDAGADAGRDTAATAVTGPVFKPRGQGDLAPSGEMARIDANLEALRTLRRIESQGRPASEAEQSNLARWSGWGAAKKIFEDFPNDPAAERAKWLKKYGARNRELRELLGAKEYSAAARTVLNAHYTDASYVDAIWNTLGELGFKGGRVLEPGSGSGTFMGYAPPETHVVGVELDPTTAGIAAALYPNHTVINGSFADALRDWDGKFDAAVGNVPFADTALVDPKHNPGRQHAIHNHFIIKSLALTRPGGLNAIITSRYTMDSASKASREKMAELADLVGAVRLPSGAHGKAAGTEVVTDLLIFRRREEGAPPRGLSFTDTKTVDVNGVPISVNEAFADNPGLVLGEFGLGGMRHSEDLTVIGPKNAAPALRKALQGIVKQAKADRLTMSAGAADARRIEVVSPQGRQPDGFLRAKPDGSFTVSIGGFEQPHTVPKAQGEELRALLHIRDTEFELLDEESSNAADTERMHALRAELNTAYDEYLATYGAINRFTTRRTGRTRINDETGEPEEIYARQYPPQGGFRSDPTSASVRGLEDYDQLRNTTRKAAIFRNRVIAPRTPVTRTDSPKDALNIAMDRHGQDEVNLAAVAALLDVSEPKAREMLGELVYDDPAGDGKLVPAAAYLSGNVRNKLDAARLAAADDRRYAANVAALRAVTPEDLKPEDIEARMGAAWISEAHIQAFVRELLGDRDAKVEHALGAQWKVTPGNRSRRDSLAATSQWGTSSMDAYEIAQALLTQKPVKVYDEVGDPPKRVLNQTRTEAAQAKANEISERFAQWVWQDPARTSELAATYNRMFNSLVLRNYDAEGERLTLPGKSETFEPHPHVKAAVARIIAEPAVGLWHEVGAGKTAEMVIGSAELKRLGLVRKPAIVVPNHMLEQFTREYLEIYPKAKLLAASSADLEKNKRREFMARAATGDWDAVILTQNAFETIPVSPDTENAYLEREIEHLREKLAAARAKDLQDKAASGRKKKASFAVAQMEKALQNAEERIKDNKEKAANDDASVTFEQTGIDYLFVDEAHYYKNLRRSSNIEGQGIGGNGKTTDLHMKVEYLRDRNPNGRVVTFATATPIANTMGEAHTMMRYLRPDLLRELGIEDFDSFVNTFATVVTGVEQAPEGGLRTKQRIAKFVNVPELLRPWWTAGDVKTAEDLEHITKPPKLRPNPESDGQRVAEVVVAPSSEQLGIKVAELGGRAKALRNSRGRPEKGADNMLNITNEGRAAALDLRLVGMETNEPTKLDFAADKIAEIWQETKDNRYPSGTDAESPTHPQPGALQIVFCDLGTPSATPAATGELKGKPIPDTDGREVATVRGGVETLTIYFGAENTKAGTIKQTPDGLWQAIDTKKKVLGSWKTKASAVDKLIDDAPPPKQRLAGSFNVYDELRNKLVAKGMPREKIRFIHEAKSDSDKARMFADARSGNIAVLIGSTGKMGVGTNVQHRAVALHHLDVPWRPADVQQREGRIIRQKNQNSEVRILRYVTEGSFDAYNWGVVARKAKFIHQMMRGKLESREMEDIGDFAMSADVAAALADGNPTLIHHAEAQAELGILERRFATYQNTQKNLPARIAATTKDIETSKAALAATEQAISKRDKSKAEQGDTFLMTVGGTLYTKHSEATDALRQALTNNVPFYGFKGLGELSGFTIRAQREATGIRLELAGVPGASTLLTSTDVAKADLITRLNNKLKDLETIRARHIANIETGEQDIQVAQSQLGERFKDTARLQAARARFAELDEQVKAQAAAAEARRNEQPAPAKNALTAELNAILDQGQASDDFSGLTKRLEAGEGFESIEHLQRYLRSRGTDGAFDGAVKAKFLDDYVAKLAPKGRLLVHKNPDGGGWRVTEPRSMMALGHAGDVKTLKAAMALATVLENSGLPWNGNPGDKQRLTGWRSPTGHNALEVIAAARASEWELLDSDGQWLARANVERLGDLARDWSIADLKALLASHGLATGGGRDQLPANLKAILAAHGLPTDGTREVLLARLIAAGITISVPDTPVATTVELASARALLAAFQRHPGHDPQSVHGNWAKKNPNGNVLASKARPAKPAPAKAPAKQAAARKPSTPADGSAQPKRYEASLDDATEGWLRLAAVDGHIRVPGHGNSSKIDAVKVRIQRKAAELQRLLDLKYLRLRNSSEYVITAAGKQALQRQQDDLADAERRWTNVPSPRVAGHDVSGDTALAERVLQAAKLSAVGGRLEESGTGDQIALALAKELGLDRPPQLASPPEFRRLARNGEITEHLYRGVQEGTFRKPAAQIQQEMRAGPLHVGLGTFGNGIYMAATKRHASSPEYSEKGNPLSVGHFGLRAEANVITWKQLVAEHGQWQQAAFGDNPPAGPLYEAFGDPGRWAMARGYDAIFIAQGESPGLGREAQGDQWAVINRSALIAEVPN